MPRTTVADAARTAVEGRSVASVVTGYRSLHDEASGGDVEVRKARYADMVNDYYDLVTDFYEYGWGQSFHFAVRRRGETFEESILRHEYYLALVLGLKPGMEVLDLGCGVGGPMRNIAHFSGARITGVNNNPCQVERGRRYVGQAGLEGRCELLKADFMDLPFGEGRFDAAFAIEATCHAPDRTDAFSQVFTVLKPGGLFAGYEWCLTDLYDPGSVEHRALKKTIEEGDALPDLTTTSAVDGALEEAGFELLETRDLAGHCAADTPWYLPLSGKEWTLRGIARTRPGRFLSHNSIRMMERLRLVPRGATELSGLLNLTADALVRSGELGVFTPLYFFLARKPATGAPRSRRAGRISR